VLKEYGDVNRIVGVEIVNVETSERRKVMFSRWIPALQS